VVKIQVPILKKYVSETLANFSEDWF
jgi:hypothetical protein